MGKSLAKLLRRWRRKDLRVLMLGLDAAGKTTILYKLKLGETVTSIPTIGFNVETVSLATNDLCIWEVGGQDKIRPLWKHYFKDTQALIFVVDTHDPERINEVRDEVHRLLNEPELKGVPMLIYANKQDLPNAMSPAETEEKLCLVKVKDRKWFIQPACAMSGDGLHEGLTWVLDVTSKPDHANTK